MQESKAKLAEKGFLGVFEYLGLQKQTGATSVTAMSIMEASMTAANATAASATAVSMAAAASATMASVMAASTTVASMMAVSPTVASATAANATTSSAMATSATTTNVMTPNMTKMAVNMTAASAAVAVALAANTSVASGMPESTVASAVAAAATTGAAIAFDAGPRTSVEVEAMDVEVATLDTVTDMMDAEMVVVEVGVGGNLNGPQQDDQASKTVRVLTPGPVWTDNDDMLVQGAGNDTSLEIIKRSVKALSDKEEVSSNGSRDEDYTKNPIHEEAHHAVDTMLEDLHQRCTETATSSTPRDPPSAADQALNLWNDRTALQAACVKLMGKWKDKDLDVIFHAQITSMVGVLNLYLNTKFCYTWRNASFIVAKTQGQGIKHARNLCRWILDFIWYECLPLHHYGQARWTVLEDEDVSQTLQLQLGERTKVGHIKAANVVKIVSSPEMQANLRWIRVCKLTITKWTACDWLKKLDWRYKQKKNGMYIDGHEWEDVVQYRKVFVAWWKEYEKCFHKWDNNGNPLPLPTGFPVPGSHFHLILITHNESTFFQNDEKKTHWAPSSTSTTPKPKGNGQSIMVLDFLTIKWGRLSHRNKCIFLSSALSPTLLIQTHTGKLGSYSRQAKIVMAISVLTISFNKSTTPSTSLRRRLMGGPKVSFFLTMPQVIKNGHLTQYQLGKW